MEVKGSKAQGHHRKVGPEEVFSERSGLMNKNRIGGGHCWTSEPPIAKSISIKSSVRISGGRARKAVEITPGDLRPRPRWTERTERGAEREAGVSRGHVDQQWCWRKARTVPTPERRG